MLQKLWWGGYSLARSFWVFFVLGYFAAFAAAGMILIASHRLRIGTLGFIVGFVVVTAYSVIAAVGVWRSAAAGIASPVWIDRTWAMAARAAILLCVASYVWRASNGGALALMARMTAPIDF